MCYAKLAKPAELLIQKPQNEAEVAGFAPRLAAHPSKARLGHKGFDQRFLSTPPNKSRPVQIPKQIPKQKA
ncbi:MAG: hypothetical protein B7X12_05965 [Halothiobacillus sp. 20-53-49]|nr:MAG: hypothetical protein B7X12_05965 [Halothiobacillus sp. 20-53-49]